jgi:hypothetical protein
MRPGVDDELVELEARASARNASPTSPAVPTKAFARMPSIVASSAALKPRAAISSGACSGPKMPRPRSTRQRSRDSAWCCASSRVSATSAQTQIVACGCGWRSLGR